MQMENNIVTNSVDKATRLKDTKYLKKEYVQMKLVY